MKCVKADRLDLGSEGDLLGRQLLEQRQESAGEAVVPVARGLPKVVDQSGHVGLLVVLDIVGLAVPGFRAAILDIARNGKKGRDVRELCNCWICCWW